MPKDRIATCEDQEPCCVTFQSFFRVFKNLEDIQRNGGKWLEGSRQEGRSPKRWSGLWGSNPCPRLGKPLYYHCTKPASEQRRAPGAYAPGAFRNCRERALPRATA